MTLMLFEVIHKSEKIWKNPLHASSGINLSRVKPQKTRQTGWKYISRQNLPPPPAPGIPWLCLHFLLLARTDREWTGKSLKFVWRTFFMPSAPSGLTPPWPRVYQAKNYILFNDFLFHEGRPDSKKHFFFLPTNFFCSYSKSGRFFL